MHKYFYASGFLYHSPTQKILLQQTGTTTDFSFTLFSGKGYGDQNPAIVFQKIIFDELGIKIPLHSISPVYDYLPQELQKDHCVLYADVADVGLEDDFQKKGNAEWFTPKQLSKLKLHEQTGHDIMIGQRVIRANTIKA